MSSETLNSTAPATETSFTIDGKEYKKSEYHLKLIILL